LTLLALSALTAALLIRLHAVVAAALLALALLLTALHAFAR
jgi:hypothetical protein